MKSGYSKRVMAVLIALCLICPVIFISPYTVQASSPSGTILNPVNLGTGGKCSTSWTKYNGDVDFYVKYKMQKQGYATITATKAIDDSGRISTFDLYLYDKNGKQIWTGSTHGQKGIPTQKYSYRIGLKKGTYTLRFKPTFNVRSGPAKTTITVKTTANQYWEIESNNAFSSATSLKLGKKYTGYYGDNKDKDYFKIKLTKGKKYKVKIGNLDELQSNTSTIIDFFDPNKNKHENSYLLRKTGSLTFTAKKTGYYYLEFSNSSLSVGTKYTIKVTEI